ncbi:MAG: hypothetical protein ACOC0U_03615, partial [Desulfovibrionales bacterium]
MLKEPQSLSRTILTGVAAGLTAGAVVGLVDRLTDRLVSKEHKRREKLVREDSAHRLAGPYFARKLLGRELSPKQARTAGAVFGISYGIVWGTIYAGLRRTVPGTSSLMGLPFAVPFFFGCDGTLAPLLGVSPGIRKLPWQINAKELGNHLVWTMTAESVHRLLSRVPPTRIDEVLSRVASLREKSR